MINFELKYKLQKLLFYSWFSPIKRFVSNLVMISQWVPVLWNNWDWDQGYLFEVIKHKLKRMADYHEKHGITVDRLKTAKQIRTCQYLLDRMLKNDYITKELNEYFDKYPIQWKNNTLQRKSDEAYKEFDIIIAKEKYMYDQDMDMFLKYIKKYSNRWWD